MIKVTDILFEIRNGYGNAFDQQEILSNDNLIPLINVALNEISKYFTHDEDLITLKLTTDNLYKMPGNVKEIIDVSEFDKEEKEYKLINLNDKHSNYFLKNNTTTNNKNRNIFNNNNDEKARDLKSARTKEYGFLSPLDYF